MSAPDQRRASNKPEFIRGCVISISVDFEAAGTYGVQLESCMGQIFKFAKKILALLAYSCEVVI